MISTLQISIDGRWETLASFEQNPGSITAGINGPSYLEYEHQYVFEHGSSDHPWRRTGLCYPISFELYSPETWPAFMLDILPSGAGRRVWLRRMGRPDDHNDNRNLDWELLLKGAGNPPGNIRIMEAALEPGDGSHPGFTTEEIILKNADFIEYAESMGAVVAGATDIPGDAPKFMLVRDHNRRWHPDGGLPDHMILDHWIVKFPRGKKQRDYLVLRNEAPYYEVARRFGVRTGQRLQFTDDTLFIPRFDRLPSDGKVIRHGLETLSSLTNSIEYRRGDHHTFCKAIAKFATDPETEILEYLKRDILNAALRNTDNHGRNTALLKRSGEKIELSPLYDFAPMFMDPDGIARASLWTEVEKIIGEPDWGGVAEILAPYVGRKQVQAFLVAHANAVRELPAVMAECGAEEEVIAGTAGRCEAIANGLEKLR